MRLLWVCWLDDCPPFLTLLVYLYFSVSTDLNLLSVLTYAVQNLKVQHILVTGHYDCGGVRAAVKKQCHGQVLDAWLQVSQHSGVCEVICRDCQLK